MLGGTVLFIMLCWMGHSNNYTCSGADWLLLLLPFCLILTSLANLSDDQIAQDQRIADHAYEDLDELPETPLKTPRAQPLYSQLALLDLFLVPIYSLRVRWILPNHLISQKPSLA